MAVNRPTVNQPRSKSDRAPRCRTRLKASPSDARSSPWEYLSRQGYSVMKLLRDMPDPVILIDPDGTIRYVNPALEKMTGYEYDEVVGVKIPYPWWPEDRIEQILVTMEKALQGGANGLEQRFLRKDGQEFWVYVSSIPLNVDGNTSYCLGRWVDITQRKQAEEHSRESDRRYRLLAQNVTDVIWVTDMDLNVTYVSPSVSRLRGYTAEETMLQKTPEILTPASFEAARQAIVREFISGVNDGMDMSASTTLELELTCQDGSTVWTEFKMALLRNEDGFPVGTVGVSRDITERKRAQEKALQHSRELAALHHVLMSSTSTLDLNQVLREIVSQVGQALNSVYTQIVLTDQDGRLITSGENPGRIPRLPFGSEQRKIAREVIATCDTLVVDNVRADQITNPVLAAGIRSYACAPIRSKNATIGVLFVHSKQSGVFSDRIDLVSAFADQAAIAIENARLYDAVKRETSRVEHLLGQIINAQESERRRLSLELHDTIAQSLYGVLAHISVADELLHRSKLRQSRKQLTDGKKSLEQTLSDLRAVAAGLHPPALEALGLVKALAQHVDKLNRENRGIKCSLAVEGTTRTLSSSLNIGIYRIVQEALNNSIKHASAGEVHVLFRFSPTIISVEVKDDGKGFVFSRDLTTETTQGHMGLAGMIERAELLGGKLDVRTYPGAGTTVVFSIPC